MGKELTTVSNQPNEKIIEIDEARVVLDQDLAEFFDIETRTLNQAVKRNAERFPEGWAFQLTKKQYANLKSQNVISNDEWGGRRTPPWAFTEHGVVMAATLLKSPKAVEASQHVVKAFVALRTDVKSTELVPKSKSSNALANLSSDFLPKLQRQLEGLLDIQANPKAGTTLRDETEELIDKGLKHLKSRLAKAGLENEEIEARILKYLADAEESRARAATEREMTEKQKLKNQANRLRLLIRAELALSEGELAGFLELLDELGG